MSYISDTYFQFPIKAYDITSVIQAGIAEERVEHGEGSTPHVSSTIMRKQCIPEGIIGWMEAGSTGQTIQDVEENGFPCTIVQIIENNDIREYECSWSIDIFEKKLNEKMQKKMETHLNKL